MKRSPRRRGASCARGLSRTNESFVAGRQTAALPAPWPVSEGLEPRRLLSVFTVTTTADSGAGSLRHAIVQANAAPGSDTINFAIPGGGVHVIAPLTPLPTITDAVTIDGYTQSGAQPNTGGPHQADNAVITIEINGSATVNSLGITAGDGLDVMASGCTIRGLSIVNFLGSSGNRDGVGVRLFGPGGDVVSGNFLGVAPDGSAHLGSVGVWIDSPNNLVGGLAPDQRNVIGGNNNVNNSNKGGDLDGAIVMGSSVGKTQFISSIGNVTGNQVQNNFIGINPSGTASLGDTLGILDVGVANHVGGGDPRAGNLISGNIGTGSGLASGSNFGAGVALFGVSETYRGNWVGTDLTGNRPLPNSLGFIMTGLPASIASQLNLGSANFLIGNLISGNQNAGVLALGAANIPNLPVGVTNAFIPTGDTFFGNQIGVAANGTALGNGAAGPIDTTGFKNNTTIQIPNGGIVLEGAADTQLGGTGAGQGNTIANNTGAGVVVEPGFGSEAPGAAGNFIGGNVISGNSGPGVRISGAAATSASANTTGTLLAGNRIGTTADGGAAQANTGAGVQINAGASGTSVGSGNIISGNGGCGVLVTGAGTNNTTITQDFIGTNAAGSAAVANGKDGVRVANGAGNTLISGNTISGNAAAGVGIRGITAAPAGVTVRASRIGTSADGASAVGNVAAGVTVSATTTADAPSAVTIGGLGCGDPDTIADNGGPGVQLATGTTANVFSSLLYANGTAGIAASNLSPPAPTLSQVTATATTTTVTGSLASTANTTFTLQFFSSPTSGAGPQARAFLGSTTVTTDSGGHVNFSAVLTTSVPLGPMITATTTSGSGGTSALSAVVNVTGPFPFAMLTNGALQVTGTAGDDIISLSSDGTTLSVVRDGETQTFTAAGVTAITVDAGGGDDRVTIGAGVRGSLVHGGGCNDTLLGGSGADTLLGGQGADVLQGGVGNDVLGGGKGGDILRGGSGNNFLTGGAGNDSYVFGPSAAAATDVLTELAGQGINALDFSALSASDPVTVNLTDDTALATYANEAVVTAAAGEAANFQNVIGGAGNDTITGNAAANSLTGGAGADLIVGGLGADILAGNGGADTLQGQGGNDVLRGGAGDNLLLGGAGNDTIFARNGEADTLDGGTGANSAQVDAGVDLLSNIGQLLA